MAILLVDDHAPLRSVLRQELCELGFRVDTAADGSEALAQLGRQAYDVIITDIEMPKMDGCSLWRSATRAGYPGHWVLMTGAVDDPAIGDPKVPLLRKPFRIEQLLRAIEGACQGIRREAPRS